MLYKYPYQSEFGNITLLANDHGLLGAWFENQSKLGGTFDLNKIEPIVEFQQSMIIKEAVKWLDAYFAKQPLETIDFQLMPQGTAFQQDVWTEMQKIPYGHTITLDELADRVAERQTKGNGSINAITGAVKTNPIAIIIPSHRVKPSPKGLSKLQGDNDRSNSLLEFEVHVCE
ncbi:methylated-DNA--[protein]-cysteine S-methyltransferase [Aerococcus urinaeequi]|uniref:methylated-DNA--[protein]-cysteine S-methyltransferase n=1 Tax=Aerococcus urinaeequi TaxID=51665 RepID=UPI003D6A7E3B